MASSETVTRYLVDARTVVVLGLLGVTSLALAGASAVFTVQAKRENRRAYVVVQRADSIVKDWVSRGCAPRTETLP